VTDADSDRQAHAEIAQANAAMPQPMSDREFRERVMKLSYLGVHAFVREMNNLLGEWNTRNRR
jgi:hypothetical protein